MNNTKGLLLLLSLSILFINCTKSVDTIISEIEKDKTISNENIQELLDNCNNCDVQEEGEKLIKWGLENGSSEFITILIENSIGINDQTLFYLIENDQSELIETLLKKKPADKNTKYSNYFLIDYFIINGEESIARYLLENNYETSKNTFSYAIQKDFRQIVEHLLEKDNNILFTLNKDRKSPIMVAIENNNGYIAALLVGYGAHINFNYDSAYLFVQQLVKNNNVNHLKSIWENLSSINSADIKKMYDYFKKNDPRAAEVINDYFDIEDSRTTANAEEYGIVVIEKEEVVAPGVKNIPDENLVAYYPFNGNVQDESGYENHGIIHGNPQFIKDNLGKTDSALLLDGKNDYIEVLDNPSLKLNKYLTMSFWIKPGIQIPNGRYKSMYIIIKGRHFPNNYSGAMNIDLKTVYYQQYPQEGLEPPLFTFGEKFSFDPDYFYHIVCVRDNDTIKLFVNNVQIYENTADYDAYSTNKSLLIGYDGGYGYPKYKGALDEIRIYNKALSNSEIEELYNENKIDR